MSDRTLAALVELASDAAGLGDDLLAMLVGLEAARAALPAALARRSAEVLARVRDELAALAGEYEQAGPLPAEDGQQAGPAASY